METINIIRHITAQKIIDKKYPPEATECDLMKRIPNAKEEIDRLEKEGLIRTGPTIHSRYIVIL